MAQYSRDEALLFLEGIEGLVMQPDVYNTELKSSCFLDRYPDPEAAAAEIRRRVAPHTDRYQVIWSSGRDLDILPAASGKGTCASRRSLLREAIDQPTVGLVFSFSRCLFSGHRRISGKLHVAPVGIEPTAILERQ
ncbi:MAG: hypothetical protein JW888_07420 [Pirellulales bacterium]|nr:hypothetical protein [Pirellulales bacterium]